MADIFEEGDTERLLECLKMRSEVDEAQARAAVARRKLLAAAEADMDGDLEDVIQEILAAAEHETRVTARSLQNRAWMQMMKQRIVDQKPEVAAATETIMGTKLA